MSPQNSLSRINGLAIFAGATFALGVATIAALDRVGAPDGLVRAMGPILALLSLAVFGLGARNADLASFIAARRSVPPFYGALGLAAIVAGIVLCLDPDLASSSDPPLLGLAAGIALGATGFGSLLRRFGATSINDVVATRFSGSPIPVVSAIVTFMTAALTAFAGYRMAVTAMETLATSNRIWAETIVATVLILSVAPGGLAGVIWCAAASAGELAMIAGFGLLAGSPHGVVLPDPDAAVAPATFALASPASLAPLVATTLAVAGFFALQPSATASRNAGSAVRAGLAGSVLCAALAAMAIAALSAFPIDLSSHASDPVAASLVGAATLASALALARVAVHASSRAFGVALADPPRPFPTPASVRLARMRGVQLAVVIGCAICDGKGLLDPRTALIAAMALSLALTTPVIVLAAIGRVGPFSASVAMLAALAVIGYLAMPIPRLPDASQAFEDALAAAAAAFVVGAMASLAAPRRGPPPTPRAFDPYADASG